MIQVAIGIDIGGTNTKFGIIDKAGNLLAERAFNISEHNDVNEYVEYLSNQIKGLAGSIGNEIEIIGIGIGVPNGNYYKGTVEFAPNLPWKGTIKFAELFRKEFNLPVVVTNDANAAAMGEMIYGAAKGMKDFILVTLGTGLGSGFVAGGELIYGHGGFAGELGHVITIRGGRLCGCGRKGCLEQYASATGIVKTVKELLESSNTESILRGKPGISSEDIYNAAIKGDDVSLKAFDYTGYILGCSLADAVAITEPEAIILFGGLAAAGDLILKPVKKYMEESLLDVFKDKVKIMFSDLLGKNAAVLGASALVWKDIK